MRHEDGYWEFPKQVVPRSPDDTPAPVLVRGLVEFYSLKYPQEGTRLFKIVPRWHFVAKIFLIVGPPLIAAAAFVFLLTMRLMPAQMPTSLVVMLVWPVFPAFVGPVLLAVSRAGFSLSRAPRDVAGPITEATPRGCD